MANSKDKWIQKASEKMEAKGTKGSFRALAKKEGGLNKKGNIKSSFIDKKANSKTPAIRKKANFAKNVRKG
jgi:hypothetical protein